ncbi:hypothetical protein F53441_10301 [Fusarium austroafricanum]|uniref:AB hydrolase-1 domain-containing protein n=1 Tax=Fusarium austroafricanum TaxID=2364996 RepID=A0A8H4NSE3_9HYPO|nr:hypothetical protein F53441_10301 [Fusarium austroafricanum]
MNRYPPSSSEKSSEDQSSRPEPSDRRREDTQSCDLPSLQLGVKDLGIQNKEAMCSRTTFFVNVDWRMGATLATVTNIVGQMYVECLEPAERLYPYPIVLIHGDFHTGQTTKPDGQPGWASFFLNKGFQVFIVDLPPSGRSNFLTPSHYIHRDVGTSSSTIPARGIESSLTAPGVPREPNVPLQYEKARFHNKWPGTGQRGDPIFAKYCASLVTLHLNKVERQSLAQNALQALLGHIGKSVLVGEGSGGTAAWLATDVEPDLVAGAIALEPSGPPFGTALPKEGNPYREYTPFIKFEEGSRIYGLADIPLTYDPPANPHEGFDHPERDPLDITRVVSRDGKSECFMQVNKARKLINIKKVANAIVTAHASSHGMYDWATAGFMMQAGVKCDWIKLEDRQIFGNGHLMFLETNSDEIAQVLLDWILKNTIPAAFKMAVSEPTPPPELSEFDASIESLKTRNRRSVESISSQRTRLLSSMPTSKTVNQVQLPSTPLPPTEKQPRHRLVEPSCQQSLGNFKKRAAPSSGQTTISVEERPDSPHPHSYSSDNPKRPRLAHTTETSTPSSSFPALPSSQESKASSDQTKHGDASLAYQQQNQAKPAESTVPDTVSMKPSFPPGTFAQLKLQATADNRPAMEIPALSRPVMEMPVLSPSSQTQVPAHLFSRVNHLYEHMPMGQDFSPLQRDSQHNFNMNNSHTTARFERQTGTAEESIAAIAMYNQSRLPSGSTHPSASSGQQYRSPMAQPQLQNPYLQQLGHSPALNASGGFMPVSTSTPTEEPFTMATPGGHYTPSLMPSTLGSHSNSPFGTHPQMTPPSPSPAPRPASNPPVFNLNMGSPASHASQKKPASE